MANYTLTKTTNRVGKHTYQVIGQDGKAISGRYSSRDYVACTIDGSFYFGRLDLIGKGDHGRYLKHKAEMNQEPLAIAYLAIEVNF